METVTVDLELPELKAVEIDPTDSALIIVDMENEFLKPGGKRYSTAGRPERAISNLAPLLARFREAGSKVIYVQSLRAKTAAEFSVFGMDDYLIEGTWGVEIVDELKPLPGEPVVKKRSNDCWNHTRMEEVLASLDLVPGRSKIVVTGCATNGCVDCAVVGFSVRDYDVSVPEDCTSSGTEQAEMLGYTHFFGLGYDYNVIPTRSDLITIGTPVEAAVLVPAT